MPAQNLPGFLQQLFYGGLPQNDLKLRPQVFFFNAFSLIGFLSVTIFGLDHFFFEGNKLLGALEVVGGVVMILNLVGLRITRNIRLASHLLLLTVLSLLLIMLITGGVSRTGIFWYFTFPPAAYFLAGKRKGSLWMIGLVLATLGAAGLNLTGLRIAYDFVEVRQLLVVLTVVTILIYLYQRNKQKNEERLAEQDKSKSEFIALASHQLRTPITAISWFSEMLLDGESGEMNEDQKDQIKHIYLSNQRLTLIVEAMLTVSSLELKSLLIKPELIKVSEFAHKIVSGELASQTTHKKLEIEEKYDHALEELHFDRFVFKIIVQNLVSNAVKYTPGGGKVLINIFKEGNALIIKVEDSGIGISKAEQDKVFSKFYRADNAKAVETDGTGLGLYIVKSIVEYVGGQIRLESEEREGTRFFISLPL